MQYSTFVDFFYNNYFIENLFEFDVLPLTLSQLTKRICAFFFFRSQPDDGQK